MRVWSLALDKSMKFWARILTKHCSNIPSDEKVNWIKSCLCVTVWVRARQPSLALKYAKLGCLSIEICGAHARFNPLNGKNEFLIEWLFGVGQPWVPKQPENRLASSRKTPPERQIPTPIMQMFFSLWHFIILAAKHFKFVSLFFFCLRGFLDNTCLSQSCLRDYNSHHPTVSF